ncbi:MAG: 30S ribosomal protein S16 [Planctomycetes bacterium]|nr:30S ribosomal protein S16 [Planctomycetota bacterium]
MPLTIRLSLKGRTNRPFFRVGVFDVRTRRDGPPVEYLGWYDPKMKDATKQFVVDGERAAHWISKGAGVSATVRSFLERAGVKVPTKPTTRARRAKDAPRRAKAAARRAAAKKA